jgi:Domain of Unknown Function (DUF1080)
MKTLLRRALLLILTAGVISSPSRAQAPAAPVPATPSPAPYVPIPAPNIAPRSGSSERLDYSHAQTLDGWTGSTEWWSVKDGVFTTKAGGPVPTSFLFTEKHYTDFRLTLRCQVIESENHAGVALWGEQVPGKDAANRWATNGPLVCFPGVFLWDYAISKSIPIPPEDMAWTREHVHQHDSIQVEILAQGNRLRAAFNGHQVLDWREPNPSRLKDGPIGLQLHGHAKPQEVLYQDVVIETFPKEDRLITLKN